MANSVTVCHLNIENSTESRLGLKMYISFWHSNLPYTLKNLSVDNECKCQILHLNIRSFQLEFRHTFKRRSYTLWRVGIPYGQNKKMERERNHGITLPSFQFPYKPHSITLSVYSQYIVYSEQFFVFFFVFGLARRIALCACSCLYSC